MKNRLSGLNLISAIRVCNPSAMKGENNPRKPRLDLARIPITIKRAFQGNYLPTMDDLAKSVTICFQDT